MEEPKIIFGNKCIKGDVHRAAEISEQYFDTKNDNAQMKSDYKLFLNIAKKFPEFFAILKIGSKVIGSSIFLPCNKNLMKKFLNEKINERELANSILASVDKSSFDCIFLAEVSVDENFRRRGFATRLVKESIKKIGGLNGINKPVFYWTWSKRARNFVRRFLTGLA